MTNHQSTGQLNDSYVTHVTNNSYCIAIVEVVNHPTVKKFNIGSGLPSNSQQQQPDDSDVLKYYVVDSDEFLQLRNLIVFEASDYYWVYSKYAFYGLCFNLEFLSNYLQKIIADTEVVQCSG